MSRLYFPFEHSPPMHSEFLDCPICLCRYDSSDRLPKILPSCGHTIYSSCLKQILNSQHIECPLDRQPLGKTLKKIDKVPTNVLILEMISSKSQEKVCKDHKEPLKFYCVVDKCEVCGKCVSEGVHKGHFVENTSEIFSKAATKKVWLKGKLSEFEGEVHALHVLLDENKKNILAIMKEKFAKLYEVIDKKEREVSLEIDLFFSQEKQRLDSQINSDLFTREVIRTKIANLSQIDINERLLKELDDDFSLLEFSSADQCDDISSRFKDIQKNVKKSFHYLMCLAGYAIEEFKAFPEDFLSQVQQEVSIVIPNDGPFMENNLRLEVESSWLVVYPRTSEDDTFEVERSNVRNLARSKDFKQISLDFRKQKLDKKTMGTIAKLWKELINVSSVKLLLGNKEFNDENLSDLCSYKFWCDNKQIKTLEICLAGTKVEEVGIKELSQIIDGHHVKTLTLNFSESSFDDKCLRELSKNLIGRLRKVKTLNLRLTKTSVSDVGIEIFFKELGKIIHHVESLELWLEMTEIKAKGFDNFGKYVLPLGKELGCLNIRYPKYMGTTANYVKSVLETVDMGLQKLTKLELCFEQQGLSEKTKKEIEQWKGSHKRISCSFLSMSGEK